MVWEVRPHQSRETSSACRLLGQIDFIDISNRFNRSESAGRILDAATEVEISCSNVVSHVPGHCSEDPYPHPNFTTSEDQIA